MTIGELADLLVQIDRDRTVYTLDMDGTAQPVAHVVDMKHLNLPAGIAIPDDVALMTANTFAETENVLDDDE